MTRPILRLLLVSATLDAATLSALLEDAPELAMVRQVTTVAEAVERLTSDRQDVTVLDLAVVGTEDEAGIRAVQAADPTAAIVVMDTPAGDARLLRALAMGVEGHLTVGHLDPVIVQQSIRFAVARKRAETERVRRALQDPLTGVQNRLALEEFLPAALLRAERRGTRIGLVFIDVDSADEVHADHGRPSWDAFILEVARRLREVARDSDIVARLTGGTFVIVCEDLRLEASVRRLADRIHSIFEPPMTLPDGAVARLWSTLGFTAGDGGTEPAELLRRSGHLRVLAPSAPVDTT